MADSGSGTAARLKGGIGWRAIWQWTHPRGSVAANGRAPVSIWYKVTPRRVEIAASIDRAIHATGLFRRHIGQRASNNLGRYRRLALARHLGRNPEAGKPHLAGVVDQHIRRLDVLMNEPRPMDLAKCGRQADGNAQEASQVERLSLAPLKNQIQWLTARIHEYEYRPARCDDDRQRASLPTRDRVRS